MREIEAMRESQRKASTYRHDLRHHLQYLSACIENGRTEAAQEYIHSVCAEIEASKVNVYCENEAANLILSSFAARAQHDGIDFRVHAAIPLILPLPDSDLCVLFSNALENALHAGQRQKQAGKPAVVETTAYEKNGRVFVRSGAGIVADSVPEQEFEECMNKARASLRALELAQEAVL